MSATCPLSVPIVRRSSHRRAPVVNLCVDATPGPSLSSVAMSEAMQGQRVLVIGGAGVANGGAISRSLAAAGASVAVADLDLARAEALVKDLADSGRTALALPVDVRSAESVE